MFIFKGNQFADLDELASEYELTFDELMERIQLSSTGVVTLRKGYYGLRNADRYLFERKTYASLSEIAKAYGVSEVTVLTRTRISDGGEVRFKKQFSSFLSEVAAVEGEVVLPRYVYKGKEYEGVEALSSISGVAVTLLRIALRGMVDKDVTDVVIEYEKRVIEVFGRNFTSIVDIADSYGISRSAFNYRIRLGYSVEDAVVSVLDKSLKGKEHKESEYVYEGEAYWSVIDLYEKIGKPEGMEFLEFANEVAEGQYMTRVEVRRKEMVTTYEWNGTTYTSLGDVAEAAGVKKGALRKKADELGSVSEAVAYLIENTKNPMKKYLLNGEYFSTVKEMEQHTGLSTHGFRKDVLFSGMVKKLDSEGNYVRFYG